MTRLLQDSLGGNARTSMIITISPSKINLEESISSLMFGQRAMKVQNKPLVNVVVDYQTLSIKLQDNYDNLNEEMIKLRIKLDKLSEENKQLKVLFIFI